MAAGMARQAHVLGRGCLRLATGRGFRPGKAHWVHPQPLSFLQGKYRPRSNEGVGRFKLCHLKLGDPGGGSVLFRVCFLICKKVNSPFLGAVVRSKEGYSHNALSTVLGMEHSDQGMLLLPSPEFQEAKRMAGDPAPAEERDGGDSQEGISKAALVGST